MFIETGPHKHAIQQTFFLYLYEPGGNRIELCNPVARLLLAPDWRTITWTQAERAGARPGPEHHRVLPHPRDPASLIGPVSRSLSGPQIRPASFGFQTMDESRGTTETCTSRRLHRGSEEDGYADA